MPNSACSTTGIQTHYCEWDSDNFVSWALIWVGVMETRAQDGGLWPGAKSSRTLFLQSEALEADSYSSLKNLSVLPFFWLSSHSVHSNSGSLTLVSISHPGNFLTIKTGSISDPLNHNPWRWGLVTCNKHPKLWCGPDFKNHFTPGYRVQCVSLQMGVHGERRDS